MEQREIDFIGQELYRETQERKKNGFWTKNDLEMEQNLYKELNALGFNFYWHMQLSPSCFTKKDTAIVPIFLKYYGKFNKDGLNQICIYCLGVKGLTKPLDFLISEVYRLNPPRNRDERQLLSSLYNAIYRIRDPKHIDDYIKIIMNKEMLSDCHESLLIVDLIGKLKIKKAIPYLVDLMNSSFSEYKRNICTGIDREEITEGYLPPEYYIKYHGIHCIRALTRYKNPDLIKYIKPYVTDEDVEIRKAAIKSIEKLESISVIKNKK